MHTELPMTCNACGITVPASEWQEHTDSAMHKGDDVEPDTRYNTTPPPTVEREMDYWRRTFAREQSEILRPY